jgi:hypothetical protein
MHAYVQLQLVSMSETPWLAPAISVSLVMLAVPDVALQFLVLVIFLAGATISCADHRALLVVVKRLLGSVLDRTRIVVRC